MRRQVGIDGGQGIRVEGEGQRFAFVAQAFGGAGQGGRDAIAQDFHTVRFGWEIAALFVLEAGPGQVDARLVAEGRSGGGTEGGAVAAGVADVGQDHDLGAVGQEAGFRDADHGGAVRVAVDFPPAMGPGKDGRATMARLGQTVTQISHRLSQRRQRLASRGMASSPAILRGPFSGSA